MAISRMQQPRQMYGLGSIVKKAVRGVKKVAKSPLGKAAIAGAIGFGIPGTNFGGLIGRGAGSMFGSAPSVFGKTGGLGGLLPRLFANPTTAQMKLQGLEKGFFPSMFGKMSTGQKIFTGLGATALAAPFLAGGPEEVVEEAEDQIDVDAIKQSARDFYMGTGGKNLSFMPKKEYVDQNFYAQQSAADGGRIGYAMGGNTDDEDEVVRMTAGQRIMPRATFLSMGGGAGNAQAEQMLMAEFVKYKNQGGDLSFEQFVKAVMQQQSQGMEQPTMAANGGRMGYKEEGSVIDQETINMVIDMNSKGMDMDTMVQITGQPVETITNIINSLTQQADGGSVPDSTVPGYTTPAGYNKFDYTSGGVRVGKAEGGIMATDEASEMIDMGGMEKDYREEGGFVAMGGEERADDVPARLSRNEFVFTADAVRNAGGGDIDRGSEVMQNLMDNLEQGGQVSEDSQGLGGGEEMMSEEIIEEPDGAQAMYEQQQALQSRMI